MVTPGITLKLVLSFHLCIEFGLTVLTKALKITVSKTILFDMIMRALLVVTLSLM